jgi:uncharacterized protein (DUF111 family)
MPRHLHIAPQADLTPELFLAALVDLGASPDAVRNGLLHCDFPGGPGFQLDFRRAEADGAAGTECLVRRRDASPAVEEIRSWAAGPSPAALSPTAHRRVLAGLDLLARSGACASTEPTALLAACALALDLLAVTTVTSDALPLPPAAQPATLAVLRGAVVRGTQAEGACVTPLGAALAVSLADSFGPFPAMTLDAAGLGLGPTDGGQGRPRLRAYLGRPVDGGAARQSLLVLEANLDDLSPEVLATLPETCLLAGALDAWLTPALMKKGRPAHCLHALCGEGAASGVEEAIFRHSSTLGIRRLRVERDALTRAWEEVETPWGRVRVKVGLLGGEPVNRAPEFEDCRARAGQAGVPLKEVYAAALAGMRR